MQFFGFVLCATFVVYINAYPALETDVITQPKPGQEYVFVQSSGTGARPIARKDKIVDESKHRFETSHKFPPSLKYILHDEDDDDCGDKKKLKKVVKREAPAPAPAGAIKLDVQKLLEKYKTELKTSTTVAPKTTANRRKTSNKRTKKEARLETELVTSPKPYLTTSASVPKPIEDDDEISLLGSASENQRSRIQIKKGPNGQEYEYEYVYYYYDDDDNAKTSNSHDGPSREQLAETTKDRKAEANEIVPSRGRTRGRQLGGDDETVNEERLPANTRFPPRSRNLNTTPLPEEETKTTTKGRGRGRSTTEAVPTEADNVSDETQGSRGRTRANVRRPSLDLVDNASFNTAGSGDSAAASSPSFPSDLPAGPVRFLGATPNEQVDLPESPSKSEDAPETETNENSENTEEETTTTMSPMDKVALDLYAILQGTQKLSGEESSPTNDENLADTTEEAEITTEITTEAIIETTTPTTTTTTTTTTTPAPTTTTTTTTTTPAPVGRGRFKGRGRKTTTAAASTTEAPQTESKPKSKFNRPSFGSRPRNRATTEASVEKEAKEETKPQTHSRPTLSRGRFGGGRTRTRTTAAPEEKEESSSSPAPVSRPSLTRPRSSFNLRNRGHTTAAPAGETSEETGQESSTAATTARPRRIQPGPGVRPLRPGPRINLARGRPGSTTTTEAAVEDHVTGDETNSEEPQHEEQEDKVEESPAPVDNSPLAKLRNKQKLQIKPKASASTAVQVRRINPLLRRRPGQAVETSSETPAPEAVSSEAPVDEDSETEESLASSTTTTTTTEEPRGLNKLLAGRRRLATRAPARS